MNNNSASKNYNNMNSSYKKSEQRKPLQSIGIYSQQKTTSLSGKKIDFNTPLSEFNLTKLNTGNVSSSVNNANNFSQMEEIKSLKNALRESMNENETLRNRVIELEALYSAAQDEIERKNKIIIEYAEYIQQEDENGDEEEEESENSSEQGIDSNSHPNREVFEANENSIPFNTVQNNGNASTQNNSSSKQSSGTESEVQINSQN